MQHFPSHLSPKFRAVSVGVAVLALAGAFACLASGLPLAAAAVVALPLLISLFAVRGYDLRGRELLIRRPGWSTRIDLDGLADAAPQPGVPGGAVSLWSTRGFLGVAGYAWRRDLGVFRAYVTDPERTVVLRFRSRRPVAVSPARPADFAAAARAAAAFTPALQPRPPPPRPGDASRHTRPKLGSAAQQTTESGGGPMIRRIREKLVRFDSIITLCASLLLLIFVAACDPPLDPGAHAPAARAATATETTAAADISQGEALYRAIFFYQGDAASKLPELAENFSWQDQLTAEQKAAVDGFVNDLATAVEKVEPGFWSSFQREIQSGDQVRVLAALDHAGDVSFAALDQVPGVADWRAQLKANSDSVQRELIRLHDEGKINDEELSTSQKQLELLLATQAGQAPQKGATSWWRGWVLALAVCLVVAVVVAVPPVVAFALALALAAAYAWAWAWSASTTGSKTLEREQMVDAIASRFAVAATPVAATATTAE